MLPHEYSSLLQPKSIWNADKSVDKCSLVEHILHLEPIEVCLWTVLMYYVLCSHICYVVFHIPSIYHSLVLSDRYFYYNLGIFFLNCPPPTKMGNWKALFILVSKLTYVFLKVNIFRGITLPDAPKFGKVFGGQFMGQVQLNFFIF